MFIITLNTHIPLHVPKFIMKKCTLYTPSYNYSNCCVPFYTPCTAEVLDKDHQVQSQPVNSPFGNYTCLFTLSAFVLKYACHVALYLGSLHFGGAPQSCNNGKWVKKHWHPSAQWLTPLQWRHVHPLSVETLVKLPASDTEYHYGTAVWS